MHHLSSEGEAQVNWPSFISPTRSVGYNKYRPREAGFDVPPRAAAVNQFHSPGRDSLAMVPGTQE